MLETPRDKVRLRRWHARRVLEGAEVDVEEIRLVAKVSGTAPYRSAF
jgi:hypothetical protein